MVVKSNGNAGRGDRLKSWKEIAAYFGTDERTVRRWEQRGLPVHRVPGGARASVYANVDELERWLHGSGKPGKRHVPLEPAGLAAPPALLRRRTFIAGAAVAGVAAIAGGSWLLVDRPGEALPDEARALLERGVEASRLGSADSTAEAVGLLQEAVRLAPESAAAWGALAIASFEGQHFLGDEQARTAIERSRAAAQRALELDPASASGQAALAIAIPTYRNWLPAETALRAVLERDPRQFEARLALSRLLVNVGRTNEALATAEPLRRDLPLHPVVHYWLAFLLRQAGRVEESDALLQRAVERWPRNYMVWFTRFWQRVYTGRPREALAMTAEASLRPVGIPDWNFELIDVSARAVMTRSAADTRQAIEANVAAARRGAGFAENAIELLAHLGALDEAFSVATGYFLDRGFPVASTRYSPQQGSYTRPVRRETKLLFSPSTEELRGDPRLRELVREIGLTAYWRLSGSVPDVPGLAG